MKAKEFSMNIPVKVKITPDGDIEFVFDSEESTSTEIETPESEEGLIGVAFSPEAGVDDESDIEEDEDQKVMVPPLQQSIELQKAAIGKESEVIDQLVDSDEEIEYEDEDEDEDEDEEDDYDATDIIHHWRSNPPWSQ